MARLREGAAFVALGLVAGAAWIVPATAASKVYSPYVDAGEFELEYRGSVEAGATGKGRQRHLLGAGYGMTDWWFVETYGEWLNLPSADLEFTAVKIENRIETGSLFGIDTGVLLEYVWPESGAGQDHIEVGLLLAKRNAANAYRLNLLFETAFEGEVEFGYAALSRWTVAQDFDAGLEAHGTLGDIGSFGAWSGQKHQFGPMLSTALEIDAETKVKLLGVGLFGLTPASPDAELRLTVEIEL